MEHFVSDIKKMRARARLHMEAGAVTEGYKGDRQQAVPGAERRARYRNSLLLRYKRHFFMALRD